MSAEELRLSVKVLGRTLLLVELGTPSQPPAPAPAEPPSPPAGQPDGETPGPITDRTSAPITQIGFQTRRQWADGRECW